MSPVPQVQVVLVYDGAGMWLCTRWLQSGGFDWPEQTHSPGTAAPSATLTPEQFDWLVAGLPWQRMSVSTAPAITAI